MRGDDFITAATLSIVLSAAIILLVHLAGCAHKPDMSRREAIGIVQLDKELRQ